MENMTLPKISEKVSKVAETGISKDEQVVYCL